MPYCVRIPPASQLRRGRQDARGEPKYRVVINREKFLRVEGVLQNQDHTISIKASRVLPISISAPETQAHDFH
jgi:hypothetical protein